MNDRQKKATLTQLEEAYETYAGVREVLQSFEGECPSLGSSVESELEQIVSLSEMIEEKLDNAIGIAEEEEMNDSTLLLHAHLTTELRRWETFIDSAQMLNEAATAYQQALDDFEEAREGINALKSFNHLLYTSAFVRGILQK